MRAPFLIVLALSACGVGSSEQAGADSGSAADAAGPDAGGEPDAGGGVPDVVIDLGAPRQVPSMAGLLVGFVMNERIGPVVDGLGPRLLRGDHVRTLIDPRVPDLETRWAAAGLERWAGTGLRHVLMLDQAWGHNEFDWQCVWCGSPNGPPWEDWGGWHDRVRDAVASLVEVVDAYNTAHPAKTIDLSRDFVLDVWNEPNNDVFWQTDRVDESYEMYCVAENAVREVLPGAMVSGPGTASYNLARLRGLLDFCRGVVDPGYVATSGCSSCRVDVLNWHENLHDPATWDPADPPFWFEDIVEHVAAVRAAFIENPTYASIGIREVTINEHTGPEDFHRPGEAIALLDALERSGASAAARSCWGTLGLNECFDRSVNGLYVPPAEGDPVGTWRPRPVAHVYEAYRAGVPARVTATATEPALIALASAAGTDGLVEILVGNRRLRGQSGGPEVDVVVRLERVDSAPALAGANRVEIEIGHLPWSCPDGAEPLTCGREPLDVVATETIETSVVDGSVVFSAGPLERHGALRLRVSRL